MKENTFRAEQKMQYIIEQFWLLYFNQFLFERGLITEEERNRMANRINNRIHPMKSRAYSNISVKSVADCDKIERSQEAEYGQEEKQRTE